MPSRLFAAAVLLLVCLSTRSVSSKPKVKARAPVACTEKDFAYVLTECDSSNQRWRVSVPNNTACDLKLTTIPPPKKAPECGFSCSGGQYLDMEKQQCVSCPQGTYSLGGGERFEDWSQLPLGFSLVSRSEFSDAETDCSKSLWKLKGDVVVSPGDECASMLVYSANLKKAGSVSFTYQMADDSSLFHVYVQNEQCQASQDDDLDRYPTVTGEGKWKTVTMPLKSGHNVIYWKAIGMYVGEHRKKIRPILVRQVQVLGLAYTSECTPCKAGTYNILEHSTTCKECGVNSYSKAGAKQCLPCGDFEYSAPGSAECIQMKPCTSSDYYATHTPCDENKKTKITYKWIKPKICRSDKAGSAQLPKDGLEQPCPPCNPGMSITNSTKCEFCPSNKFSNGSMPCQNCPGSTAPVHLMNFTVWHDLPSNMDMTCLSFSGSEDQYGCSDSSGWEPAGNLIHSGQGYDNDVYLILSLSTDGFVDKASAFDGKSAEVRGTISFVFELKCTKDCILYFTEETAHGSEILEYWENSQEQQSHSHSITSTERRSFSWAFQKALWYSDKESLRNDMAIIHSITVTNTVDGGAARCKPCPTSIDSKTAGCVPCAKGNYVDNSTNTCKPCPKDTYLRASDAHGRDSCLPCGPGTSSHRSSLICNNDCQFKGQSNRTYDFSTLNGFNSVMSGASFTAVGNRFYHSFNMSLCGYTGPGRAFCMDNITYNAKENSTTTAKQNNITAMVCRSTVIPVTTPGAQAMSAQPVSLGDRLMSVKEVLRNQSFFTDTTGEIVDMYDVEYYFQSPRSTDVCGEGRSATIHLRCDPQAEGKGQLELPQKCPEGTCDGCTFHFLWKTEFACPLCTQQDFQPFYGECREGQQSVQYIWNNQERLCHGGVELPTATTRQCQMPAYHVSLAAEIAVMTTGAIGCFLVVAIIYFWKKTRKLEYKYQRLMQNSNGKEGELPNVDSCAIDEEDDGEEDDDQVIFEDGKKGDSVLFKKLKAIAGKDEESIETLQLTSSGPNSRI